MAFWVGIGLALGGAVIALALFLLGGARPQPPNLGGFLGGDAPARHSPPPFARLRTSRTAPREAR